MSSRSTSWLWPLVLALSGGIPLPAKLPAQAAPVRLESGIQRQVSSPPPASLVEWLQKQIDAANRRDLPGVMAGYSPDFRHRDGLDRQGVEEAIRQLWEAHPQLTYSAQIVSWRQVGPEIVAEIASQVQGSQASARGSFRSRLPPWCATATARMWPIQDNCCS